MTNVIVKQFRVDLDRDFTNEIKLFLGSMNLEEYCVSYEISDLVGKPHFQGWIKTSLSDAHYRRKCNTWAKGIGLDPKKKEYCFGNIKDFDTYRSYIICNQSKSNVEYSDVITNISEMNFNILKDSLPEFKTKSDFTNDRKNGKSLPFLAKVFEVVKRECTIVDMMDEIQIDYPKIKKVMLEEFGNVYKPLDNIIIERHVLGVTNSLETLLNVRHRKCQKVLSEEMFKGSVGLSNLFNIY